MSDFLSGFIFGLFMVAAAVLIAAWCRRLFRRQVVFQAETGGKINWATDDHLDYRLIFFTAKGPTGVVSLALDAEEARVVIQEFEAAATKAFGDAWRK